MIKFCVYKYNTAYIKALTWDVFLHARAKFSSLAFFHFSLLFSINPRVSFKCLALSFVCKLGKVVSVKMILCKCIHLFL